MIAALQMYDWDEVRPRADAYWVRVRDALRADGIDAPETLMRPEDLSVPWRDTDLLIGQTCGLPYVSGRCDGAVLLGQPDYGLEQADAGTYRSALICHAEDDRELASFRGAHAAINEIGSQSGCNALADMIQREKLDDGRPFFANVTLSGSHRASARLIAERKAEIAAIDAVAWALFEELEPVRHARLRVLGWSRVMPALPFITAPAHAHLGVRIFRALLSGCPAPGEPHQAGIPTSFIPAEDENYDPIRKMVERLRGMRLAPNLPPL